MSSKSVHLSFSRPKPVYYRRGDFLYRRRGARRVSQITSTKLLVGLRDCSNQQTWNEFCSRYRPVVINFARQLGLSEEDAQDVAQETLLAFMEGYSRGHYERAKGRLRKWLLGIARNKILYLKRKKVGQVQPHDKTGPTGFFERLPDTEGISRIWESQWQQAVLQACLREVRQQFEPKTMKAFEMLTLRELPSVKVAAELGMSTNAVLKASRRVLSRMRELHQFLKNEW